jgi:bifunctional UDP-N-acetylglucosamine pyrophosphorylase/glucosamine-1-phosphate N-acetyltransferase
MSDVAAVILAAGKGTRMKSGMVKVMHRICGRPMVEYPVAAAREAGASQIVVVVGHQSESVQEYFSAQNGLSFRLQEEQLGTGHAVACAAPALVGFAGPVFILCGDVPLVRGETLRAMLEQHRQSHATITVMTAFFDDPFGYGRIVRNAEGQIGRIVEEKDATATEREIHEINSGIYCVEFDFLAVAVANLKNDNAQKEYYLTDIIKEAAALGLPCLPFPVGDPVEISGVNDRVQLADAARIVRRRINNDLMLSGVTMIDPEITYIDKAVAIGPDTIIHPNVTITGTTSIGANCVIETGVSIDSCTIGDKVKIKSGSVLEESVVHNKVTIGPMAHLRPGSELLDNVKIGNFVETKKIVMGEGSKASHLTYLGDATIGRDVNIGCGTITCNYDGVNKHRTVIEDEVFVGSDVQFVAPVTVGRNSLIAAGTTVTKDVPPDSLAIARAPQVNKDGWKLKQKS